MKYSAFTIIELLVVIVIIGILATISTATFQKYSDDARSVHGVVFEREVEQQMIIKMNTENQEKVRQFMFEEGSGTTSVDDMGGASFTSHNGTLRWSTDTPHRNSKSSVLYQGGVYQRSYTGSSDYSEVTVSAWVNPAKIHFYSSIFFNGTCGAGLRLQAPNGIYYRNSGTCGNTNGVSWYMNIPDVITEDRWQHVLFTDNGTESRIYIDGTLVGTTAHAQTQIKIGWVYAGLMYWGGNNDYKLDSLQMWPFAYNPE